MTTTADSIYAALDAEWHEAVAARKAFDADRSAAVHEAFDHLATVGEVFGEADIDRRIAARRAHLTRQIVRVEKAISSHMAY